MSVAGRFKDVSIAIWLLEASAFQLTQAKRVLQTAFTKEGSIESEEAPGTAQPIRYLGIKLPVPGG